jgi:hypothetical protein
MRLRYELQASRSALCALLSTGESSLSRPTRYALATATELRSLGLRVPAATRLLTRRSNARAALAPGSLCVRLPPSSRRRTSAARGSLSDRRVARHSAPSPSLAPAALFFLQLPGEAAEGSVTRAAHDPPRTPVTEELSRYPGLLAAVAHAAASSDAAANVAPTRPSASLRMTDGSTSAAWRRLRELSSADGDDPVVGTTGVLCAPQLARHFAAFGAIVHSPAAVVGAALAEAASAPHRALRRTLVAEVGAAELIEAVSCSDAARDIAAERVRCVGVSHATRLPCAMPPPERMRCAHAALPSKRTRALRDGAACRRMRACARVGGGAET